MRSQLSGLGVLFHKFVLVSLAFVPRSLLTEERKAFQQVRNFAVVSHFPQPLDQMIERSLVLRIAVESLPALFYGQRVVPRLKIELRQYCPDPTQSRLQRHSLLG